MAGKSKSLPERQIALVEDALYTTYDLSDLEAKTIGKFFRGEGSVDAYCLSCGRQSVFRISGASYGFDQEAEKVPKFGLLSVEARCNRDSGVSYLSSCAGLLIVCFYRDSDNLTKIGQFPSRGDLDFGALDPVFSKELDENFRKELGTAIGLHAHGVGIGSFVYLRRIFEGLIEEAHRQAAQDREWDEPLFEKSRMAERIQLLHAHLPNRLVKTSHLYGILSRGVHDLTEEECKENFDILRRAILMILKERNEDREYGELVKDIQKRGEQLTTSKGQDT
jgi:hypothetical protein